MNLEQFEKLNEQDKALAKEAFEDGYKAATETVRSYQVRTGVGEYDRTVNSAAKTIAGLLEDILLK